LAKANTQSTSQGQDSPNKEQGNALGRFSKKPSFYSFIEIIDIGDDSTMIG
jgi:hypothetical protein